MPIQEWQKNSGPDNICHLYSKLELIVHYISESTLLPKSHRTTLQLSENHPAELTETQIKMGMEMWTCNSTILKGEVEGSGLQRPALAAWEAKGHPGTQVSEQSQKPANKCNRCLCGEEENTCEDASNEQFSSLRGIKSLMNLLPCHILIIIFEWLLFILKSERHWEKNWEPLRHTRVEQWC